MKEYANNFYDTIENITYDLERYDRELVESIPTFMSFIQDNKNIRLEIDSNEKYSNIYNTIGFIIGNSEKIFFEHVLAVSANIIELVEQKNRMMKNEIMKSESCTYSKDAYNFMIDFYNNEITSTSDCHSIDIHESIKTHYRKIFQKIRNIKFENFIELSSEEMLHIISKFNSILHERIFTLYTRISHTSTKIAFYTFFKEIISCLLVATNFVSSIYVNI